MAPAPIRLGVLPDAPVVDIEYPLIRGIRLKVEQTNAAGGVEGRAIELVYQAANGAHEGLPENVVGNWYRLAEQREIVGIIGPGITDNCLVLCGPVAREQVPTICWPGTELARNEWYFQFQLGTLPDEGPYLVRLIARLGHRRVGVLQTGGPVGDEYFNFFAREAHFLGVEVVAHQFAPVHEKNVAPRMQRLRDANPEAVVFLGMQEPTLAFGRAVRELSWDIPRFANIAMMSLARTPAAVPINEGIIWVDQYEPRNPVLAALERDYVERFGDQPQKSALAASGWDMATLMIEGLKRAPNLSREGLKVGLERVHQLPCATGGRNPVMGFGPWDRQAIKGADLLMYRTVRNGELVTYEG